MDIFKLLSAFFIGVAPVYAIVIKKSGNIIYLIKDGNSTDDQKVINRVLKSISKNPLYDTLYLKGEAVFVIDEPILMPSGTKLTGDSSTLLKLKDHLKWKRLKPMISQSGIKEWTPWGSKGDRVSDIEIYGFKIDGGLQDVSDGDTYYPLIHFYNPYNIKIHDMKLSNSKWDIIRFSYNQNRNRPYINSKIYNNEILNSGHEGIAIINLKGFEIYNNKILHTRTNCGIRLEYTDEFKVFNNTIGNSLDRAPSGNAGICINNRYAPVSKGEIYNNYIYGKNGGIVLDGGNGKYQKGTRSGVSIYYNRLYKLNTISVDGKVLGGGIRINGFDKTVIEYNEIKDSKGDGIVYEGSDGKGSNYETVVRYNKIVNNSGYAIYNSPESKHKHKFILKENIIKGNGKK